MIRARLPFAVALLAALLAPRADAGPPGTVPWSESLDKAIAEAQQRNVPIVAFYLDDKDKDCDRLRATFASPKFIEWAFDQCVTLVGHEGGTHEAAKRVDPKTKKEVPTCPKYAGIECSVHERGFADAGGKFVWHGMPSMYVLKPSGELVVDAKELQDPSCALVQQKVAELQKKLGEPCTRTALRAAEAELTKGDERLAKEKWLDAAKHYEKIAKDKKQHEACRKLAEKRLEDLDAKTNALVEEAKNQKDRAQAIVKLRKLAADVKGRAAGEAAKAAAAELEKQPAKPKPAAGEKPAGEKPPEKAEKKEEGEKGS